jgi:hypothetical protein
MTSEEIQKKKLEPVFNSDIDNFIGVKNIRNYIIASLNDTDSLG